MNSPDIEPSSSGADSTEAAADETNVRQKVAGKARQAAARVKSAAGEAMAKARDEASHLAADKQEAAANRIGGYSSAIHDSAQSLEEKDPNVAWFAHRAADKLQEVAEYVRGRSLSDLRDDASSLARRHPAAYFGGLFAVGLIVGNLIKASPRQRSQPMADHSPEEPAGADMSLAQDVPAATWGGA